MKLVVTQLGQVPPAQSEVASGIVAQPGGQAGATVLTARVNVITVVAPGTAVRVSIVNGRYRQDVSNRSGESLPVFPPVGHGFVGQAVNTAVTLADGDDAVFLYRGSETWDAAWTRRLARDLNLADLPDKAAAWANLGGGAAGKLSVGAGLTSSAGALSANVRTVVGRAGDVTLTMSDLPDAGSAATRNVGSAMNTVAAGDDARIVNAVQSSVLGQPSGVATLGADGKLATAQLPSGLMSGMNIKGVWNAATNTPPLASGVGTNGDIWVVGTAGTTTLDGYSTWAMRDEAWFADGAWRPVRLSTTWGTMATQNADNVTITKANLGSLVIFENAATGDISIQDPLGFEVVRVTPSGVVEVAELDAVKASVKTLNATTVTTTDVTASGKLAGAGLFMSQFTVSEIADGRGDIVFADALGFVGFELKQDGTLVGAVDEAADEVAGAYPAAELAARDARSAAQSMAVRTQGNYVVARPVWKYNHGIGFGQSLSLGYGGSPRLSTTLTTDNLCFGLRPANTDTEGGEFVQSGDAAFYPLTSEFGSEVPIIGMSDHLRRNMLRAWAMSGDPTRLLVANAAGDGGRSIEELSEGADPPLFDQVIDLVTKAKAAATAAGGTYGVTTIFWAQGEANAAGAEWENTEAGYLALFQALVAALNAAIMTVTGQADPPLWVCLATSSYWDTTGDVSAIVNAQMAAALADPNIVVSGPYYQSTDTGGHPDSDGYREIGEKAGQVVHRIQQGEGWLPCHVRRAWFRGDRVLLEIHTPEPPLQVRPIYVGTTEVTHAALGFRAGDDDGALAVLAVQVLSSSIELQLNRPTSTAKHPWAQYAAKATFDGGGNICDSDPVRSRSLSSLTSQPYRLWNWLIGGRWTLVEDI